MGSGYNGGGDYDRPKRSAECKLVEPKRLHEYYTLSQLEDAVKLKKGLEIKIQIQDLRQELSKLGGGEG